MDSKVYVNVQIDRKLTEQVIKRLSERDIARPKILRMLMAQIIRDREVPDELDLSRKTSRFLYTGDTVATRFQVDTILRDICDYTLNSLRTNLPSVIAAFYAYIANTEESPLSIIQFVSTPVKMCREVVPVGRKLMREFEELLAREDSTMTTALIAYMQRAVESNSLNILKEPPKPFLSPLAEFDLSRTIPPEAKSGQAKARHGAG